MHIQEIIRAFMLIFIAEMGDKTQILAMAFATRYPVRKVLIGIGLGAFLNHGLAVVLGNYLSRVIPISTVQMIAGIAFIGFALWTLKPEQEEADKEAKVEFGPVATVAMAFFLGELGDKTQLTAITLAADSTSPMTILAGTVLGMVATGALGIYIGKKLGDKIPELGIKVLASCVFAFFGVQKLLQTVPAQYLNVYTVVPSIGLLGLVMLGMIRSLIVRKRSGIQSEFLTTAKLLRNYYLHLQEDLDHICLGAEYCGTCAGRMCAIGKSKEIVKAGLVNEEWHDLPQNGGVYHNNKPFKQEEVLDCLVDTLCLIGTVPDEKDLANAHLIRNQMEEILLGHHIESFESIKSYIEDLREVDAVLSKKIAKMVRVRNTAKQPAETAMESPRHV